MPIILECELLTPVLRNDFQTKIVINLPKCYSYGAYAVFIFLIIAEVNYYKFFDKQICFHKIHQI